MTNDLTFGDSKKMVDMELSSEKKTRVGLTIYIYIDIYRLYIGDYTT